MSTDLLRRAAAAEREEWGGDLNARLYPEAAGIHLALADLLDSIASYCGRDDFEFAAAVVVAHRILGEDA
jgi:hypothetical protein